MVEATEADQFDDSPQGWAQRLQMELTAARNERKRWITQGDKIDKRFKDERETSASGETRVNVFSANIQTLRALLYGQTPKVEADRRFADANDDQARVGAEMLERMLNSDIQRDSDGYALALQYALDDRLLPGGGACRLRYVMETGTDPQTGQEVKTFEDVETDHLNWKDWFWFAGARTWHEVRGVAFMATMTRADLKKRFGEEIGKAVPLNHKTGQSLDGDRLDPWGRAEVWEIWSKEQKRVFWYVEGYPATLDTKPDPLGLDGFFPCARPMLANVTTASLIPRPDFVLAQDLYDELDTLSTRITLLERAVRVAGVYNRANVGVQDLLSDTTENTLTPIENWGMFAEGGGVKGQIDWLPLDQIVGALDKLREYRNEVVQLIYQVTGLSDIMRGAAQTGATATEQSIKAKFASVRVEALQKEFARFASDTQHIRAEIISKHFDPQTIIKRSNVEFTADAQYAQAGVQLIKDKFSCYRIEVKPESVAMEDMASLKKERVEFLQALPALLTAMIPAAQAMPGSTPVLLRIIQWAMASFKGSSQIEGVLDQLIAQTQQQAQQQAQNPQQQPPDPRIVAAQMKAQSDQMKVQADMQKTGAELQADLTRISAETQAEVTKQQQQAYWNTQEEAARAKIKAANEPMGGANGRTA